MAYEELTELLQTHKKELAYKIAGAVVPENNPAQIEQVANGLEYNIAALAIYLQTGNFEPYKQLVSSYYQELFARNVPMSSIQRASDIFFSETKALIKQEFSSQEQTKLKEAALRRIEMAEQMQLVTLFATSILNTKKQN